MTFIISKSARVDFGGISIEMLNIKGDRFRPYQHEPYNQLVDLINKNERTPITVNGIIGREAAIIRGFHEKGTDPERGHCLGILYRNYLNRAWYSINGIARNINGDGNVSVKLDIESEALRSLTPNAPLVQGVVPVSTQYFNKIPGNEYQLDNLNETGIAGKMLARSQALSNPLIKDFGLNKKDLNTLYDEVCAETNKPYAKLKGKLLSIRMGEANINLNQFKDENVKLVLEKPHVIPVIVSNFPKGGLSLLCEPTKDIGMCLIGVPKGSKVSDNNTNDFYWLHTNKKLQTIEQKTPIGSPPKYLH